MADEEIDFNAHAILRKWPSLNNERIPNAWGAVPYLICEGTLVDCIRKFASYPVHTRHLYEIHVTTKPGTAAVVLPQEQINELARFQLYLISLEKLFLKSAV